MNAINPNLCARCLAGIDDDQDGNCKLCAGLSDQQTADVCRNRFSSMFQKVGDLVQWARDAAFEEIRDYMAGARLRKPLAMIDDYRRLYPKHGDFQHEREAFQHRQVSILLHPDQVEPFTKLCKNLGIPVRSSR